MADWNSLQGLTPGGYLEDIDDIYSGDAPSDVCRGLPAGAVSTAGLGSGLGGGLSGGGLGGPIGAPLGAPIGTPIGAHICAPVNAGYRTGLDPGFHANGVSAVGLSPAPVNAGFNAGFDAGFTPGLSSGVTGLAGVAPASVVLPPPPPSVVLPPPPAPVANAGAFDDIDDIYNGAPPPDIDDIYTGALPQDAIVPLSGVNKSPAGLNHIAHGVQRTGEQYHMSDVLSFPDPALVSQAKNLCRVDRVAKAQWCNWCDANVQGTKDPNRLDNALLTKFFEAYHNGQIPYDSNVDKPVAELCGDFKRGTCMRGAACRFSHDLGSAGQSSRGPVVSLGVPGTSSRSAPKVVAPPLPPPPERPDRLERDKRPMPQQAELAEIVRVGQRISPAWKVAWVAFCDHRSARSYDPSKHDRDFLHSYLDFLGTTGAAALNSHADAAALGMPLGAPLHAQNQSPPALQDQYMQQVPQGLIPLPEAKRQRTDEVYHEGLSGNLAACGRDRTVYHQSPGTAGPLLLPFIPANTEDNLANCVKELQKRDSGAKQLWCGFCDAHAKGIKDPSRHDELSLRAFFQFAGLPQPDAPAG